MSCIGLFSDDVAGAHAALLIATGLAEADIRVGVATALPVQAKRAPSAGDDLFLTFVHLDETDEESLAASIAWCRNEDRDIVVALPLTLLRDARVLSRFDVAISVGRDRAAAARALQAARYVAVDPARHCHEDPRQTPWFLACSDQSVLRTAAGLTSLNGPTLPVATRVLPTVLPRLDRDTEADLLHRSPTPRCAQAGIVLAAVALAAAEPMATRIDASTLTDLMAGQETGSGEISHRLVALAMAYDRLEDAHAAGCRSPLPAPRRRVAAGACFSARDRVRQATCRSPGSERVRSN